MPLRISIVHVTRLRNIYIFQARRTVMDFGWSTRLSVSMSNVMGRSELEVGSLHKFFGEYQLQFFKLYQMWLRNEEANLEKNAFPLQRMRATAQRGSPGSAEGVTSTASSNSTGSGRWSSATRSALTSLSRASKPGN